MVENYLLRIDRNLREEEFDRLLGLVAEEKRQRVRRFRKLEDAQRTLLGDILSRFALCRKSGLENHRLLFGANEYGKPLLTAPCGLHFSISHSGAWVACALHDRPIGIDVEEIKQIDFAVAERFFSKAESMALQVRAEEEKLNYFYMLWTLKESYIKAEGKGLSLPLNSFTVEIGEGGISLQTEDPQKKNRFFKQFFLDGRHVFALCAAEEDLCRTHTLLMDNVPDFIGALTGCCR